MNIEEGLPELREILDRTAKKIEVLRREYSKPVDPLEEYADDMADIYRRLSRLGSPLTVIEQPAPGLGRTPNAATVARRQKAMRIVQ